MYMIRCVIILYSNTWIYIIRYYNFNGICSLKYKLFYWQNYSFDKIINTYLHYNIINIYYKYCNIHISYVPSEFHVFICIKFMKWVISYTHVPERTALPPKCRKRNMGRDMCLTAKNDVRNLDHSRVICAVNEFRYSDRTSEFW